MITQHRHQPTSRDHRGFTHSVFLSVGHQFHQRGVLLFEESVPCNVFSVARCLTAIECPRDICGLVSFDACSSQQLSTRCQLIRLCVRYRTSWDWRKKEAVEEKEEVE